MPKIWINISKGLVPHVKSSDLGNARNVLLLPIEKKELVEVAIGESDSKFCGYFYILILKVAEHAFETFSVEDANEADVLAQIVQLLVLQIEVDSLVEEDRKERGSSRRVQN